MTSEEFSTTIKIPKDRIAVLIGEKGQIKRTIEKETGTKIEIDSKEGDVFIKGEDGLNLMTTKNIILAIARGFNPKLALQLLKMDYILETFNIQDYGKSKNDIIRLKGRVIGEGGKSRKVLEDLTECQISVYGKTIAVIGEVEMMSLARRAVDMLLCGAPHRNVYKWLEKQRRIMGQVTG